MIGATTVTTDAIDVEAALIASLAAGWAGATTKSTAAVTATITGATTGAGVATGRGEATFSTTLPTVEAPGARAAPTPPARGVPPPPTAPVTGSSGPFAEAANGLMSAEYAAAPLRTEPSNSREPGPNRRSFGLVLWLLRPSIPVLRWGKPGVPEKERQVPAIVCIHITGPRQ